MTTMTTATVVYRLSEPGRNFSLSVAKSREVFAFHDARQGNAA